jgi:DNA-binding NarL/FixJ family response regulator
VIKQRSRKLFYPIVLGFLVSIVIIIICARIIPRYIITVKNETSLSNNGEFYYCDINHDGNSEKIHYYHYDKIFQPTLYLYNQNDSIDKLWNFFDNHLDQYSVFFGDYNNDNFKEICVFTRTSDSLFLDIIDKNEFLLKRQFLCVLSKNVNDLALNVIGLYNFNSTIEKELIFSVDASYPKQSRNIFSFDICNKKIIKSLNINGNIEEQIVVDDLNNDNKLELYLSVSSIAEDGNGSQSEFLSLDNNLHFSYTPVSFSGTNSRTTIGRVYYNNEKSIAVLNSSLDSTIHFNNLMIYNAKGEKLIEKSLDIDDNLGIIYSDNKQLLLFNGHSIVRINNELGVKRKITVDKDVKLNYVLFDDINGDNRREFIFIGTDVLYVIDENLNTKTKINFSAQGDYNLTIKEVDKKPKYLSVQIGNKWYMLEYFKNEIFFNSNVFYLLIILGVSIIIIFIVFVKKQKLKLKKFFCSSDSDELLYQEIEENINKGFNITEPALSQLVEEDVRDSGSSLATLDVNKNNNEIGQQSNVEREVLNILDNLINEKYIVEFFPKGDWNHVDSSLQKGLVKIVEAQVDGLKGFIESDKKLKLQIFKHPDYINILVEIDNVLIAKDLFINKKGLLNEIEKLKGSIEIAHFSEFGTIVNTLLSVDSKIPLKSDKSNKIRLILAEDHDVSLFGLISLFKAKTDFEIVGTAKNGMEVMKMLKTKKTDIVITDISMPGMDGIELSEQIKNQYPEIKVIVFTMYLENWFIEQLINNGAMGFVSKNSKIIELVSAVRAVYEGANYYCPQFKSKFGFNGKKPEPKFDSLSKNEFEIMKYYADGLNRNEISKELTVSNEVMESFIANILLKLNAGDEEEIIRIAKKQKYISE